MTRKEQKEARRIQILKATLDLFVKLNQGRSHDIL